MDLEQLERAEQAAKRLHHLLEDMPTIDELCYKLELSVEFAQKLHQLLNEMPDVPTVE